MTYALLQFLGLIYLTAGIAMALKPDSAKAGIDSFLKSPGMNFLAGMLAIVMGGALVTLHHAWGNIYEIIVSAIGWGALIEGFLYLAFPKDLKALAAKFYKNQSYIRVCGLVALVIGALFMAMGQQII